jgi:hypothetical protein
MPTHCVILDLHKSLYGDDLNTMVATARVYDKLGDQDKATLKPIGPSCCPDSVSPRI